MNTLFTFKILKEYAVQGIRIGEKIVIYDFDNDHPMREGDLALIFHHSTKSVHIGYLQAVDFSDGTYIRSVTKLFNDLGEVEYFDMNDIHLYKILPDRKPGKLPVAPFQLFDQLSQYPYAFSSPPLQEEAHPENQLRLIFPDDAEQLSLRFRDNIFYKDGRVNYQKAIGLFIREFELLPVIGYFAETEMRNLKRIDLRRDYNFFGAGTLADFDELLSELMRSDSVRDFLNSNEMVFRDFVTASELVGHYRRTGIAELPAEPHYDDVLSLYYEEIINDLRNLSRLTVFLFEEFKREYFPRMTGSLFVSLLAEKLGLDWKGLNAVFQRMLTIR